MTELVDADAIRQRRHGFGYADGRYICVCRTCNAQFAASKRSVRCAPCADAAALEWCNLSDKQHKADAPVSVL